MKPLVLLFDLDGTLTDPRPPLRETFATLLENRIYAGVGQMLDEAREAASAAFVATLKPKLYADRIGRRLGFEPYFAGVYGPELEGRFDDKVDLLAHLLASEKVSPERAVMIGDRAGDIAAARANRVRSIGVLWGYGSESELADARADGLCVSPGELGSCLRRLAI